VELAVWGLLCLIAAWFLAAGVAVSAGSFYRWLPIGDAPRWMRRRMLGRRGRRADGPSKGPYSIAYDITCHELDGPSSAALTAPCKRAAIAAPTVPKPIARSSCSAT
jgi:hypothetical protein